MKSFVAFFKSKKKFKIKLFNLQKLEYPSLSLLQLLTFLSNFTEKLQNFQTFDCSKMDGVYDGIN